MTPLNKNKSAGNAVSTYPVQSAFFETRRGSSRATEDGVVTPEDGVVPPGDGVVVSIVDLTFCFVRTLPARVSASPRAEHLLCEWRPTRDGRRDLRADPNDRHKTGPS